MQRAFRHALARIGRRTVNNTLAGILAMVLLANCSGVLSDLATGPASPPPRAFWRGHDVSGSPRIVIDLSEQRLRYYKGGSLVGYTPIASGRAGYNTPTGTFRVTEKDIDHRSSCYGDYVDNHGRVVMADIDNRKDPRPPGTRYLGARMHYFMRINGPIGMHEGFIPGYPASHGCIRLPTEMAAILYRETPIGTPVVVQGHASAARAEAPIRLGQRVLESGHSELWDRGAWADRAQRTVESVRRAIQPAPVQAQPPVRRGQTQYLYY